MPYQAYYCAASQWFTKSTQLFQHMHTIEQMLEFSLMGSVTYLGGANMEGDNFNQLKSVPNQKLHLAKTNMASLGSKFIVTSFTGAASRYS